MLGYRSNYGKIQSKILFSIVVHHATVTSPWHLWHNTQPSSRKLLTFCEFGNIPVHKPKSKVELRAKLVLYMHPIDENCNSVSVPLFFLPRPGVTYLLSMHERHSTLSIHCTGPCGKYTVPNHISSREIQYSISPDREVRSRNLHAPTLKVRPGRKR